MVTNQGCSYSHSGQTTVNEYYKNTESIDYDFTSNGCSYTSTNTADTDCPLYLMLFTDLVGTTRVRADKYSNTVGINVNSLAEGYFGGLYYKVGLPGNPFNTGVLTGASQMCTLAIHICGPETPTEASAGN